MRQYVTITARRLKRLEAADNVARAVRTYFGTPNYKAEERQEAMSAALDWSTYWLSVGTKDCFTMPPPLPKRWKYNRDQAMRGWPDKQPAK